MVFVTNAQQITSKIANDFQHKTFSPVIQDIGSFLAQYSRWSLLWKPKNLTVAAHDLAKWAFKVALVDSTLPMDAPFLFVSLFCEMQFVIYVFVGFINKKNASASP